MKSRLTILLFILASAASRAQYRPTGMIYDPVTTRAVPYKAPLTAASYQNLPTAASLEKYCPVPGDQGAFGTCVAFATAYHLRTILYVKAASESGTAVNPNNSIFSPSFIYEQIKRPGDVDCQGGADPVAAFDLLKNTGVARLVTQPYTCGISPKKEALLESVGFKITDYQILYLPDETDVSFRINTTKKAIAEGYPCMLGFIVAQSFYGVKGDVWREQATDDGPTGKHGRHAMCIVGYDDNKYGGAFRVLNSWGTAWADKGYVWIPYKDYAKYAIMAIQAYGPKSIQLNGNVNFRTNAGTEMPAARSAETPGMVSYQLKQSYGSGTEFRFFINTNTEAYLYAFATDESGKVNKILPFADNMSPHIGPGSTIAFPSEKKVVRMDANPGTDYLLILYARKPLDADQLWRNMNQMQGTLAAKIRQALGSQLVDQNNIDYNISSIGFSVKPNATGNVVPVMVSIAHK